MLPRMSAISSGVRSPTVHKSFPQQLSRGLVLDMLTCPGYWKGGMSFPAIFATFTHSPSRQLLQDSMKTMSNT